MTPIIPSTYFPSVVRRLARDVKKHGGRALVVGGAVRDFYLRVPTKDFDVEVYGLPATRVEQIVRTFGRVSDVGRSFGILKVRLPRGGELDVSLPRQDSKVAPGHRGFAVKADPFMSVQEAARRRDFTMNALAADSLSGEVFDYFGGIKDARRRVLRVTDPDRFGDDPLRALRAVQMVGRFRLHIDPASAQLIARMAPRLRELPKERIAEEWKKLFLRSERPSRGLVAARQAKIFSVLFPRVRFVSKDFLHVDAAPKDWTIRLSVFCSGQTPVQVATILSALDVEKSVREKVFKLTQTPPLFCAPRDRDVRLLGRALHPATIQEYAQVRQAIGGHCRALAVLVARARALRVFTQPPRDIIRGRDLQQLGFLADKIFSRIIEQANDLRDHKDWSRRDVLRTASSARGDTEKLLRLLKKALHES